MPRSTPSTFRSGFLLVLALSTSTGGLAARDVREAIVKLEKVVSPGGDLNADASVDLSGASENHGLLVHQVDIENHSEEQALNFASLEYPVVDWRPQLVVEYADD